MVHFRQMSDVNAEEMSAAVRKEAAVNGNGVGRPIAPSRTLLASSYC